MPPRMLKGDTLLNDRASSERDKTLYQKKIGEIVWITHTIPESISNPDYDGHRRGDQSERSQPPTTKYR